MSSCRAPSGTIRILVVEDHGIVREGICELLDRQDGMTVVGSAASCREAILEAQRLSPDLITMDLILPDMNGIDATERILRFLPLAHIVMLSAHSTIEHVYCALRAGAHGYVIKGALGQELVHAVRAVMAGKRFLSPGISPDPTENLKSYAESKSPLERLSFRERQILHQIVAGSSSTEIGVQMSLSRKTVDTYRSRLMTKLGIHNRSALIRFAIEHESAAV
jgi:DNA-binding NarL/FixJ family response regulator